MKFTLVSSLRLRLLFLVLLAILPALVLIIINGQQERRAARAQAEEEARRIVNAVAIDQEQLASEARALLGTLAHIPEVQSGDPATCSSLLAGLMTDYPHYTALSVLGPDGIVICSGLLQAMGTNASDREHFQRALQTRDFASSGYIIGRITGKAIRSFALPVVGEAGRVEFVVVAALDLAWVYELAARADLPAGSTLTIVDRAGVVLARHPDPGEWLGKSLNQIPLGQAIQAAIREGRQRGIAETTGTDGVKRLYVFAPLEPVPNPDAFVAVGFSSASVFAEQSRLLARHLAILGTTTAFALLAAWVGGGMLITRQASALVRDTRRLAAGDLAARRGPRYPSGEFGELGRAFDSMAASLEARHAEVKAAEERAIGLYTDAESARRELAEYVTRLKRARETIIGLSVPVLEFREGLLLVPLIGEMDDQRARLMNEQVLPHIRAARARVVVLDITGLASMDSYVVRRLLTTTEAAKLLGAQVILTGVSTEVSRTLVEIGADLSVFSTMGDLQSGVAEAERLLQKGIRPRETSLAWNTPAGAGKS